MPAKLTSLTQDLLVYTVLFLDLTDVEDFTQVCKSVNKVLNLTTTTKQRLRTYMLYLKQWEREFPPKELLPKDHVEIIWGPVGDFPSRILSSMNPDDRKCNERIYFGIPTDTRRVWYEETFLKKVCLRGWTSLALLLLKAGADPNAASHLPESTNGFRETALASAVHNNNFACVKLLLRYGADPTKTSKGSMGCLGIDSLLMYANRIYDRKIYNLLLRYKSVKSEQ